VGWIAEPHGLTVALQDRRSGEQMKIVTGDDLDDYGYVVIRVARDGVLLEDTAGMRYLLKLPLPEDSR
jgi:hypothetical protein